MGRRTRADAISADALFQLRRRLRRRRPSQPAAQPRRRDRLDRELYRHRPEVAARRAVAAGSARAAGPAMGPGRPDHPASALEMGAMGRHLSGRPRAAERQSAGVAAAADGTHGTGIPGLSEFRGLYRMEQLADLFHHRGLSRHPHRRCAADAAAASAGRAIAVQRTARDAAVAGARRLQCRQGRRHHGPAKPNGCEGDADQIRLARRFMADRRIAGAAARRARASVVIPGRGAKRANPESRAVAVLDSGFARRRAPRNDEVLQLRGCLANTLSTARKKCSRVLQQKPGGTFRASHLRFLLPPPSRSRPPPPMRTI